MQEQWEVVVVAISICAMFVLCVGVWLFEKIKHKYEAEKINAVNAAKQSQRLQSEFNILNNFELQLRGKLESESEERIEKFLNDVCDSHCVDIFKNIGNLERDVRVRRVLGLSMSESIKEKIQKIQILGWSKRLG